MKKMTEADIENFIRNSRFPNPAHKSRLREQLAEGDAELDFDDLARVSGGAALPESDVWSAFPGEEGEKK